MVSIRTFILVFTALIVLPIAAFLLLLIWSLSQADLQQVERRFGREANAIATAVKFTMNDMKTTVQILTSAPELGDDRLAEFHARTRRALDSTGQFAIVVDSSGQQLLNTRVEYGTPLGPTSDMETFKRAVDSGEVIVSDVFYGRVSGAWVFNVIIPLAKRDTSPRAIIVTKNAGELHAALPTELPLGWQAAIVDSRGQIIASTAPTQFDQGKPLPDLADVLMDAGWRDLLHKSTGDDEVLIAADRVSGTEWRAVVWGPLAAVQPSLLANWHMIVVTGTSLLALSMLAGLLAAAYLRRSVVDLSAMAKAVGRGETPKAATNRIAELSEVSSALATAAARRKSAEEHLRIAAKEIAHRLKNLIAVISAVIRQSTSGAESGGELSSALLNRIGAMGRSIDLILDSADAVDVRALIECQVTNLGIGGERFQAHGHSIALKSEAVQALGMSIYELTTNAVKYGALSNESGRVEVSWELEGEGDEQFFTMTWTEHGGPPPREENRSGFGTTITTAYLESALNGETVLKLPSSGLEWTLRAPSSNVLVRPAAKTGELSRQSAPGVLNSRTAEALQN